jgi:CxxC-x17-CxxC domain-containing protein
MEAQDRTIKCATCGREFIFTVKEQAFFASKGFKEPRHCRECRQQRKQAQVQVLDQAVSNPPAPRVKEMFKVVCGNCNRETLVPFKPITGKPVLCKDCFIAQRYGVTTAGAPAKKAAPEAEKPAPTQEVTPAPPPSEEPQKDEIPESPGDDQKKSALSDSPDAAPKPPITEQESVPPPALAAKEPGGEP